ncbi:Acyl-coenzyme A thioesterase 8 [Strongyloides ratti]|uniref:Acyl-coenzyme A thioesterase 8 n=1 Tax=Strongyloides ratti TaxID=34506 RepID=A0A090L161_STRRB|nr:Acyl-coenzyme A thioesterase 8 [Strongyloides ratti]CEF61852.1 Acyl-coenzyme A thioesterase 8 [Strongyloides ratti]
MESERIISYKNIEDNNCYGYSQKFVDEHFELEYVSQNVYRSIKLKRRMDGIDVVFGGNLCAQSLCAAEKSVPSNFKPHSLHSYFILSAKPEDPVYFHVTILKDNRSFVSRIVEAKQYDKLVYYCTISFHVKEESSIEHQIKMPKVKMPEELKNTVELADKYLLDERYDIIRLKPHVKKILLDKLRDYRDDAQPFEARPVSPEHYFGLISYVGEPILLWVKAKDVLKDIDAYHRYLTAYISDYTLVYAADRQHVSHGYEPSMYFSLDHHIWFHEYNFRADEWLLYENRSTVARNGRAYAEGRFWTKDGKLIVSTAQESLNRTRNSKSKL